MNSNKHKLMIGLLAAGLCLAALGQGFAAVRNVMQHATSHARADWESPLATHIITAPDGDAPSDGNGDQADGNLADI